MTEKEFEINFNRLYLPLGMYGLRIVGDADIAEDIVQDCFLKVWEFLKNGGDIDNFSSFMYRSVRNGCISFLRKRPQTVGEEMIPDISEEDIDTSVRDARIWKAIDDLPPKCREVFLLSKRDGLNNDEIARNMDISIKTVKNQMTKAYSRLRDALSDGHRPIFLPFL